MRIGEFLKGRYRVKYFFHLGREKAKWEVESSRFGELIWKKRELCVRERTMVVNYF